MALDRHSFILMYVTAVYKSAGQAPFLGSMYQINGFERTKSATQPSAHEIQYFGSKASP